MGDRSQRYHLYGLPLPDLFNERRSYLYSSPRSFVSLPLTVLVVAGLSVSLVPLVSSDEDAARGSLQFTFMFQPVAHKMS